MRIFIILLYCIVIFLFCVTSFGAEIDNQVLLLEQITGCKLVVTSGFRSPEKNKAVGGSKNSYHLKDRARDLIVKDPECISISLLGKIACFGMSTIVYKKHIHIDNREVSICIDGSY